MKLNIENLKAGVRGMGLTLSQRADAIKELDALIKYVEELEAQLAIKLNNNADPNCTLCRGRGEYSIGGSFGGGQRTFKCDCK